MQSARTRPQSGRGSFRLVRYFTATSLAAFIVVGVVLYALERRESDYFREVQNEQTVFVAELHEQFARQHEDFARADLVITHEAEHVKLARLLANALWDSHFAPFVRAAVREPVEHCRALAAPNRLTGTAPPNGSAPACFAAVGKRLMALPEFRTLDKEIGILLRRTPVFKIKVFDTRGITVYSSEHAQIGEDKRANEGWFIAADGQPASELTHRDTFSAFEGVVENRDLISSYVPVFGADGVSPIAVFEIYSDVTPFLERIKRSSAQHALVSGSDQEKLSAVAAANQKKVDTSSYVLLATVGALLAVLYVVLLAIVRNAQRLIDAQAGEREQSIRREERLHREKMSVLATMAATVGHEIGNPLATISGVAEEMAEKRASGECDGCRSQVLLEQTRRIAAKTRQMADFTSARNEVAEWVDVNHIAGAVCEFLAFDQRFRSTTIEFEPGEHVPARLIVPDHLTEVLMNLLEACVGEGGEQQHTPAPCIHVRTESRDTDVVVRIRCDACFDRLNAGYEPIIASTQRRVSEMRAALTIAASECELVLPAAELAVAH